MEDLHVGDSIAVNGVCLTVTEFAKQTFQADVMPETMNRSSLGMLRTGSHVNLERAMPANGRFGGHIVSGHIDGTGVIAEVKREENAVWYTISAGENIMRYIIEKGSVAIDGISLTVAKTGKDYFKVSVIPHTMEQTILPEKRQGDRVNLENDQIGKYIEHLLGRGCGRYAAHAGGGTYIGTGKENQWNYNGFFTPIWILESEVFYERISYNRRSIRRFKKRKNYSCDR